MGSGSARGPRPWHGSPRDESSAISGPGASARAGRRRAPGDVTCLADGSRRLLLSANHYFSRGSSGSGSKGEGPPCPGGGPSDSLLLPRWGPPQILARGRGIIPHGRTPDCWAHPYPRDCHRKRDRVRLDTPPRVAVYPWNSGPDAAAARGRIQQQLRVRSPAHHYAFLEAPTGWTLYILPQPRQPGGRLPTLHTI